MAISCLMIPLIVRHCRVTEVICSGLFVWSEDMSALLEPEGTEDFCRVSWVEWSVRPFLSSFILPWTRLWHRAGETYETISNFLGRIQNSSLFLLGRSGQPKEQPGWLRVPEHCRISFKIVKSEFSCLTIGGKWVRFSFVICFEFSKNSE